MGKQLALKDWDEARALRVAEAVGNLMEHPGYPALLDAIASYEASAHRQLLSTVRDSAAEYADVVGQLKGLRLAREIPSLIIEHARALEDRERAEEAVANG